MSKTPLRLPSRPWTVWTAFALLTCYLGWRLTHAVPYLTRQSQRENCIYWGVVEEDCYHDDRFAWLWLALNVFVVLWCGCLAVLAWRGFTFGQIMLLVSCVGVLGVQALVFLDGILRHPSTFAGMLALTGIVVALVLPPTFRWLRACDEARRERRSTPSATGG